MDHLSFSDDIERCDGADTAQNPSLTWNFLSLAIVEHAHAPFFRFCLHLVVLDGG